MFGVCQPKSSNYCTIKENDWLICRCGLDLGITRLRRRWFVSMLGSRNVLIHIARIIVLSCGTLTNHVGALTLNRHINRVLGSSSLIVSVISQCRHIIDVYVFVFSVCTILLVTGPITWILWGFHPNIRPSHVNIFKFCHILCYNPM